MFFFPCHLSADIVAVAERTASYLSLRFCSSFMGATGADVGVLGLFRSRGRKAAGGGHLL